MTLQKAFKWGKMTVNNFNSIQINKPFMDAGYVSVNRPLNTVSDVEAEKTKKSFGDFLMDAISKMNDQQIEVGRLGERAMVDPDSVQPHEITEALAKSQMSLSLAKTVVDRVVTGWNEITTTR